MTFRPLLKLLHAASNIAIDTTGTSYDLSTLVGTYAKSGDIFIHNTGATDVYVGYDQNLGQVDTSGAGSLRVIGGSSKTRSTSVSIVSLKTASGSSTIDIEIWG